MTTMSKPRRKLPPVKSRSLRRKGNHPSNPYAGEAATAPQLEDRPGYPFAAPRFKTDLSDEAQLGEPPKYVDPPLFVLRATDPLGAMLTRAWANMTAELGLAGTEDIAHARRIALAMDEWRRKKNSAGG
jgi:hypothetical protein